MSASVLPNFLPAATLANYTFMATTLYSGVTVPTYNTTSPTYALWNPLGSNRLMMPVSIKIGVEATGTAAIGALGLSQVLSTTSSFATGLPIATWTDSTVYNGRVGKTGGNNCRFSTSLTLTSAGTFFYHLGLGLGSAVAGLNWNELEYDFNGELLIEPGNMIHLVGVPVGPGQPLTVTTTWIELDLTGNIIRS
jgi:hypothetical protein